MSRRRNIRGNTGANSNPEDTNNYTEGLLDNLNSRASGSKDIDSDNIDLELNDRDSTPEININSKYTNSLQSNYEGIPDIFDDENLLIDDNTLFSDYEE